MSAIYALFCWWRQCVGSLYIVVYGGKIRRQSHCFWQWQYAGSLNDFVDGDGGIMSAVTQLSLKTNGHLFKNFVVIVGTVSCHYDNLRCCNSRQSCQIDDLLFSVLLMMHVGCHMLLLIVAICRYTLLAIQYIWNLHSGGWGENTS